MVKRTPIKSKKKNKQKTKEQKPDIKQVEVKSDNALAVAYYNGIGNFIQLIPALKAFSKFYGDVPIDLIRDKDHKDSRFDACAVLADKMDLFRDVVGFPVAKDRKYKDIFLTNHSQKPDAWAWASQKTKLDLLSVNWGLHKIHEVDFYMEHVRNLGYKGPTPKKQLKDFGSYQASVFEGTINIALINGFFKEERMRWERKTWSRFGELARMLHWFFGDKIKIYLLGFNAQEKRWAQRIVEDKPYILSMVGKLDIIKESDILGHMDLVISTDTGLMHVADAKDKPYLITLYGATLVSKNGPYNRNKAVTIKAPVQCAGCQANTPIWKQCGDEWRDNPGRGWPCMDEITVPLVFEEVRKWYKNKFWRMC